MMKRDTFQLNYSMIDPCMRDELDRHGKAEKIVAIMEDYAKHHGLRLGAMKCLEIGCSLGGMSVIFGNVFKHVAAIDIDIQAIHMARHQNISSRVSYYVADALRTRFADMSFDVVICNHVYEHVSNARQLMTEIRRLLKKSGICYFAGPQKYTIIEPHYHMPFLSWLPKSLASEILRMLGKGTSYWETPLSVQRLKGLVHGFQIADYSIEVLKKPKRYHATHLLQSVFAIIPTKVYSLLYPMLPSFFWILTKKL